MSGTDPVLEQLLKILFQPIIDKQDAVLRELQTIRRLVAKWSLPVPGPLTPRLVAERDGMLIYEADFPAKPSPLGDTTTQRFGYAVNGGAATTQDYPIDAVKSDEFAVADGDSVVLSMTYLDDAVPPNESAASTQSFTAHDTIPPTAPGDFGKVTLVREE